VPVNLPINEQASHGWRQRVNAVAILRWLAELGSLSGPCFWRALRRWAGCRSAELLVSVQPS
jgi:hypothetical protein